MLTACDRKSATGESAFSDTARTKEFAEALQNGNTNKAKFLLQQGGIDLKYENGVSDRSFLVMAAKNGDTELVKLMLDKGADLNSKSRAGVTALMAAAGEGRVDVVKLLLTKGANPNAKDNIGQTALTVAADSRCTKGESYPDVVKALLEKGVDVNAQGSLQETALMKAAGCGDLDTVKVLLEGGADVRPPREWDYSALTHALNPHAPGENNDEMIKLLLKYGAKANDTDLAIAEQSHVNKDIYALLVKSRQIPVNIR